MAKRSRDSNASSSIDGALAQFDYALLLLARASYERVGIETLDDVAGITKSGSADRIQLKQSLAETGYTVTLRSVSFWKTLAIWADAVGKDASLLDSGQFVLVATRVTAEEPVSLLTRETSEAECIKLAQRVLQEASTPNKDLAELMPRVAGLGEASLARLFARVRLCQLNLPASADDLKKLLHVPRRVSPDRLVEGLRGWISSLARCAWANHQSLWIDSESFSTRRHQLCTELEQEVRTVRPWNKVTDKLDPTTVAEHSTFLRQLKLVGADREELEEAVIDFLKHKTERHRLSTDGEASDGDFIELEHALIGQWQPKWRTMRDSTTSAHAPAGLRLYRDVLHLSPPQLASTLRMHQPFCRGGYQVLSNDKRVGWHARFVDELDGKKGTES